ncbi:MAG: anti-sigma regulatory factor [Mycobacterium sp.]|nr:anti-sigma regulatory factor [Mycobacterium sp.]
MSTDMRALSGDVIKRDAFTIIDETDMMQVRQVLRSFCRSAGLSLVEETKFITAGSELARNILTHTTAHRGEVIVEQLEAPGHNGVRAAFIDDGPGIPDMTAALTDGFSTVGSMGLGLPGAKRLVDDMTIDSSDVSGTRVVITKWAY